MTSSVETDRRLSSRRDLLRRGGVLAVAGAAASTLARPAAAQEVPHVPAMRSPGRALAFAAAGEPTLPATELIALNRIAFGPRPGDLAAIMALGATGEERLQAFVEQQLNPAAIDDSDCEARIAAQGFTTLGKSRQQLWADHVVKDKVTWDERMQPA